MITSAILCAFATFAGIRPGVHAYSPASIKALKPLHGVLMDTSMYRGKRATVLTEKEDPAFGCLAVVLPGDFKNGTIEFDEAGQLTPLHNPSSRSFVGIAFHISDDLAKYECFYLRMTNGRSTNQELRNHAVQYCMIPDHRWDELRQDYPFKYEAYTDLELGAWRHVKISVFGKEAKFYVGNAKEPTLVVHDLFLGDTPGKLALWVGGYTRAYFANVKVKPA